MKNTSIFAACTVLARANTKASPSEWIMVLIRKLPPILRACACLGSLPATEIPRESGRRGPVRDMLTIFDEGGAVVACADLDLAAMIRGFRWRELFWKQRARVLAGLRFVVFGHAVLEQALAPWPGITCKALIVPVERALIDGPPAGLVAALDAHAADWLAKHAAGGSPKALAPLPVFGYPGWLPGSAQAAFYEDTRYFRALRAEAPAA